MKLNLSISIALSLLGAALSGSLDGYLRRPYQTANNEYGGTQHFQPSRANANAQGHTTGDVNRPEHSDVQYYPSYFVNMQGRQLQADNSMPELHSADLEAIEASTNAEYIKEIQYQVQSPREGEELELQSYLNCIIAHSKPDVLHGAKIALQVLFQKRLWLGCASNPCVKATCPQLFMEGDDWNKCGGEVFQIYRAAGPGNVKVGDTVGLFAGGEWFSMYKGQGHTNGCPGKPTTKYGFATRDKWYNCGGEVFQIYAKGKSYGDTIQNHDYITIYYVLDKKWVAMSGGNHPHLEACPGEARPPPPDRYDTCWGEIFELWLR